MSADKGKSAIVKQELSNVIPIGRAHEIRAETEFSLAFPHMYEDIHLAARAYLAELKRIQQEYSWNMPEDTLMQLAHSGVAVCDAMLDLGEWIQEELDGD